MIHNEAEQLKEALQQLHGVKSVTRGWPKALTEQTLPCIAISKAADTPMDFRDDRAYLAELEYYIRIFADRATQVDELAPLVDEEMTRQGYARTFAYDDDNADIRIQTMRYRKYV